METLQAMAKLARAGASSAEIAGLAQWCSRVVSPGACLDSWVREHFRYRDENEEVIRTPQRMMHDLTTAGYIEGDCDDVSTLYASAFKAMGIPVRFVAIRYDNSADFKHVFVEALENLIWQRFDATVPQGTVHVEVERMVVYV